MANIDWSVWALAAGVIALLAAYLVYVIWHGGTQISSLVKYIEKAPERRRIATEQEAKAGKPRPLWYRALQTAFILAAIGLAAYALYTRTAPLIL
ncbi:MAG: hypothetical protein KDJ19_00300 [Hyphomicrobiaceae bacterium]|nr:hypothetical protein [Hyphomicrobiaceae bacterium]MCC0023430.1 hypothetical protein [Hyphomicrobiaceae bacterium]